MYEQQPFPVWLKKCKWIKRSQATYRNAVIEFEFGSLIWFDLHACTFIYYQRYLTLVEFRHLTWPILRLKGVAGFKQCKILYSSWNHYRTLPIDWKWRFQAPSLRSTLCGFLKTFDCPNCKITSIFGGANQCAGKYMYFRHRPWGRSVLYDLVSMNSASLSCTRL